MVGQIQWFITLRRFDIKAQVISMSRDREQLKKGHLERLKRIYAHVIRTKDYATRLRVMEPDYSYLPEHNLDWTRTVYGHVQQIIRKVILDPLGQTVTTTTVDTNLNNCLVTG